MSLRRKVMGGALQLGIGQAMGQLFALTRNVIIAGLLAPSDYGIAATFLLTMAMMNIVSHIAADKLLIQSPHGDDEAMQRTIHATEIVRGLLSGAVLFMLAPLAARLFQVPEATWAFQMLGLIPMVRGFRHLDIVRAQRHHRFMPLTVTIVASQGVALALAWPVTMWLGDYSAVLWILLAKTATLVVVSHLLAKRPYRIGWNPQYGRQVLHFGWPLLVNGLLIYAAIQGDQLVIGASYSMAQLGVYAAAAGIAMAPAGVISQIFGAVALPTFSQAQGDIAEVERLYRGSLAVLAYIAGGVAIFFLVVGPALMTLLYPESYKGAGAMIGLLGVLHAVRIMRAAPSTAAIAMGDTRNPLYANVWRSVAFVGIVAVAAFDLPVLWIVVAGIVGEGLGFAAGHLRLCRKHGLSRRVVLKPLQVLSVACLSSTAALMLMGLHSSMAFSMAVGLLIGLAYTTLCMVVFPQFRLAAVATLHDIRRMQRRSNTPRSTADSR